MDTRDLEYFAMIARHRHLGRAAEALGLGQPALSMSLRRLEKSARAKLVTRTPKGVELTTVGAALLPHVRKLQLVREDLAQEVADLALGRSGHVRIGASPSNADIDLPEACRALLMEAPGVTLDMVVMNNDGLLPALRKGELDIAITHTRQLSQPEVIQERIRHDEFVAFCAAKHPLARLRSVTVNDLVDARWVAATSASGEFGPLQILRQAFEARGLPAPKIVFTSDLVPFKLRAVADSDLLGTAVKGNVLAVAAGLALKILPVKDIDWVRPVAVAYRKDTYISPAARRLIEILKAGPRQQKGQ
jgi:DNA-binding transcriptional LysR family regulator